MPVYNGEETIASALDSLLAQTYRNFLLHISDNCSTDNTGKICERYAGLDDRISYTKNDSNIGGPANFNKLLQAANGELFMWAASDDIWDPQYIEELVGLLGDRTSTVFAFCAFDFFDRITGCHFLRQDMSFLADLGSPFRWSTRFFLKPEGSRKEIAIYGIGRTDVMRQVGGLVPNAGGGLFDIENHALFSIGLIGGMAISDRLLFHKSDRLYLAPDPCDSVLPMPAPRGEIINSLITYRALISVSKFSSSKKTALHILAVVNFMRTLSGSVIETALQKWKEIPLVWRIYCWAEKRLQIIHVLDDPSSSAIDRCR